MVLIVVASAALLIISLSVAFWCSVEHEKSNHLILNDPNKIAYEHVGVYVIDVPFVESFEVLQTVESLLAGHREYH